MIRISKILHLQIHASCTLIRSKEVIGRQAREFKIHRYYELKDTHRPPVMILKNNDWNKAEIKIDSLSKYQWKTKDHKYTIEVTDLYWVFGVGSLVSS